MDRIHIPYRYFYPHPEKDYQVYDSKKHRKITLMKRGLVQIYSVQFIDCCQKDLEHIRGRIFIFFNEIFNRGMDNHSPHYTDPKGYLRLKGPLRPIDAGHTIYLETRLYRRNHREDYLHPDSGVEVDGFLRPKGGWQGLNAHGSFSNSRLWLCDDWSFSSMTNLTNQIISSEMETICGRLKITYGVFDNAAECFLTLKILDWKGKDLANVYGKVVALNSIFGGDERAECVIYDRKRDEPECVKTGQFIELQRPEYALGLGQKLTIKVHIKHVHMDDPKSDLVIADGTLSFQPKVKCNFANSSHHNGIIDSKKITGEWGKVQVKAYWLPYWAPSFDAGFTMNPSYKKC